MYKKIFEQLATEDIDFMDDEEEISAIPGFGNSTSDYETVVGPFYAYWQSYCTKKSYTWLFPHNLNDIRGDRRIARALEKESKKIAQRAKRERNEEVRALVAFVKKRDKRVIEYRKVLEERALQNRLKQQDQRIMQIKKNQKEVEEMKKQQANNSGFNCFVDFEEELKKLEKAYGSDEEEDYETSDTDGEIDENDTTTNGANDETTAEDIDDYIDHLYCVACNKSFKNELSYTNHESSKKHKSNIERLKLEMQADEEANDLASGAESLSNESEEEIIVKTKKSKKKAKKFFEPEPEEVKPEINNVEPQIENSSVTDVMPDKTKKSHRKSKTTKTQPIQIEPTENEENGWSDEDIGGRNKKNKKGAKAAAKQRATGSSNNVKLENSAAAAVDDGTEKKCVTCNTIFSSKNKLFEHLKKMNHGVPLDRSAKVKETSVKSKNHKKK